MINIDAVLTARGARKAAGFVKFCDAFNIPVLKEKIYKISFYKFQKGNVLSLRVSLGVVKPA